MTEEGGEGGKRKRGTGPKTEREGEKEGGGGKMEETHYQEEGVAENRTRTEKSETETEAGGEVGTSSQTCYKKGQMANIYFTNSDKVTIGDFVKDHKELYDKRNEHFKARKECLWERSINSHKLFGLSRRGQASSQSLDKS